MLSYVPGGTQNPSLYSSGIVHSIFSGTRVTYSLIGGQASSIIYLAHRAKQLKSNSYLLNTTITGFHEFVKIVPQLLEFYLFDPGNHFPILCLSGISISRLVFPIKPEGKSSSISSLTTPAQPFSSLFADVLKETLNENRSQVKNIGRASRHIFRNTLLFEWIYRTGVWFSATKLNDIYIPKVEYTIRQNCPHCWKCTSHSPTVPNSSSVHTSWRR